MDNIEVTGRLEVPFVLACSKAKLPYVVANPIHVRRFAGAIGQIAKTDKLDAQLIGNHKTQLEMKTPSVANLS